MGRRTFKCPACGRIMSIEALTCPHCGQPNDPGATRARFEQMDARIAATNTKIVNAVAIFAVCVGLAFMAFCAFSTVVGGLQANIEERRAAKVEERRAAKLAEMEAAKAAAPSPMAWKVEAGDHYGAFTAVAGNAYVTRDGKPFGPDLTSANEVWIGCIDKKLGVLLYLSPGGDRPLEYALGDGSWVPLATKTYGPYGYATWPGVKDPVPFLKALDVEPRLRLAWTVPAGVTGADCCDEKRIEVKFNLSGWRDAAEKASAYCKGWPKPVAPPAEAPGN